MTDDTPDDSDDPIFLPPNGGAYEKREARTGPPLTYVGEKLESCICRLSSALACAQEPHQRRELLDALQYGVTAFLALYNLLGLTHDPDYFHRLAEMSPGQFRAWASRVSSAGKVCD